MSEVVFYPDFGRPCPDCKCRFSSSQDFNLHRRVCPKPPEWKPSQYNDVDTWIFVSEDPKLAHAVLQNGKVLLLGDFEYTLNQKQTIIKRRRV